MFRKMNFYVLNKRYSVYTQRFLPLSKNCIYRSSLTFTTKSQSCCHVKICLHKELKLFRKVPGSPYSTFKKFVFKPTAINTLNNESINEKLQQCKSMLEQICILHSNLKLSKEDVACRHAISQDIANNLKQHFPDSNVDLLGSSVTGLGRKGCDVDLSFSFDSSVAVKPSNTKYLKKEILSGKVPTTVMPSLPEKQQLYFIQKVLEDCCLVESIAVIPGRCPILSFRYKAHHCELSICNVSAYQTTNFIRFCTGLDDRVEPLFHVISYISSHIIGGIEKFKSYAFFLLLVYFLQTRKPPILPSVADMLAKADFLKNSHSGIQHSNNFQKTMNMQTLDDLLNEFYFFYLNFDFSFVINTFQVQAIEQTKFTRLYASDVTDKDAKFLFNAISIQDPLRESWNVATEVSFKNSKGLIQDLLSICDLYQTKSALQPFLSHKWGLSAFTSGKFDYNNLMKKNICVSIPLTPFIDPQNEADCFERASQAVYKVFSHCLKFECQKLDGVSFVGSSHPTPSKRLKTIRKYRFKTDKYNLVNKIDIEESDVFSKSTSIESSKSVTCGASSYSVLSQTTLSSSCEALDVSPDSTVLFSEGESARTDSSNTSLSPDSNSQCEPIRTAPLLTFKFIAADTWSGRSCWDTDLDSSGSSFADIEHDISTKMLEQRRTQGKEKTEFLCECKIVSEDEQAMLFVSIKPLNCDVFIPKMAVILREYVERCVTRILSETKC